MKQMLTDNELSAFSGQLAMILHSGISVLEGVSIMQEDMPEGEGRNIIRAIYSSLEETGELAEALLTSGVFPEYFIKMTEIGERSGTLEEVMSSLCDYYKRQESLTRSIREALTYPLILICMLFAVLLVLMTQVMPVFGEVFEQLGIKMTGVSSMIFRLSGVMQAAATILLVMIVLLALACVLALRSKKGREMLILVITKLPLGRKVMERLARSRFSDALSLALHSGLDMGESFTLAAGLTDQKLFQGKMEKAAALLEEGSDLADSLRDASIITGLNARMLSIGFRTGSAEDALKQIAVSEQEEADNRIQKAVGALEPTMTAVLSLLTGIILVSVMLPLLSVMANIG